jgi:acyl carrier protein
MVDEASFIERAVGFLVEISGEDPAAIDADTPLLEAGFFDSLALIAFLEFLERERGRPLAISPLDGIPVGALASIRAAYRQLLADD